MQPRHFFLPSSYLFLFAIRAATFSSANNTHSDSECHVFYSTPTFYPDAKLSSHLYSAFISRFLFPFTTFKIRNDVSNSHTLWNGFHNTRCIIILILSHEKAFCFNFCLIFFFKKKTLTCLAILMAIKVVITSIHLNETHKMEK